MVFGRFKLSQEGVHLSEVREFQCLHLQTKIQRIAIFRDISRDNCAISLSTQSQKPPTYNTAFVPCRRYVILLITDRQFRTRWSCIWRPSKRSTLQHCLETLQSSIFWVLYSSVIVEHMFLMQLVTFNWTGSLINIICDNLVLAATVIYAHSQVFLLAND